jgi:DNA helicase-2/ATP-dependent DNA helicase PcrA
MNNQLQTVWMGHEKIKQAIESKSSTTPKKLLEVMDAFKSIGFDHVRHDTQDKFLARLSELREQGLTLRIAEIIDELTKCGVFDAKVTKKGEEIVKVSDRELYSSFFRFWREATDHLLKSATFTLEDQKYGAYLDEKQKLTDGKFLSGVAKYDHVLVDEFQDINPLDLALIKTISDRNRATLTIVGDDDQAIFEWRGTSPHYILNPEKYFERTFDLYALQTNYRSPKNIVEMSQRLIAHNLNRVAKNVSPNQTKDAEIEICVVDDLNTSMELVLEQALEIGRGSDGGAKLAVIGRKRSQLIPYQIFFASHNLSFCAAEDLQVFLSKAFDRLLQLLFIRLTAQSSKARFEIIDQVLTMCNLAKRYPLKKAELDALKRHLSLSDARTLAEMVCHIESYRGPLKGSNVDGKMSSAFADCIRAFTESTSVASALLIMGSQFEGLQVDMGKAEDDIFFVDPPFLQLAEFAQRYGTDFERFINDIENAKQQLVHVPPFEEEASPSDSAAIWKRPIHLMTALRSKGKEFDNVVLLDVNEGIWPSKNAREPAQKEAERRVFYVAFTRAKQKVLILSASKIGNKNAIVSPFLNELGIDVPSETAP